MSFVEIQFPPAISYGAKGGVSWLTRIVATQAGDEYRGAAWATTRGSWDVSHGLKTPADLQALIEFHTAMQGRLNGFRFKDWNDYQDWGLGTVETNPSSQLQLAKTYSVTNPGWAASLTLSYVRFISKPAYGTVTCAGATVDYATGLVTGVTAGTAWTGQFDIPCRFDTDKLDLTIEQPDGSSGASVTSSWPNIQVVELRSGF